MLKYRSQIGQESKGNCFAKRDSNKTQDGSVKQPRNQKQKYLKFIDQTKCENPGRLCATETTSSIGKLIRTQQMTLDKMRDTSEIIFNRISCSQKPAPAIDCLRQKLQKRSQSKKQQGYGLSTQKLLLDHMVLTNKSIVDLTEKYEFVIGYFRQERETNRQQQRLLRRDVFSRLDLIDQKLLQSHNQQAESLNYHCNLQEQIKIIRNQIYTVQAKMDDNYKRHQSGYQQLNKLIKQAYQYNSNIDETLENRQKKLQIDCTQTIDDIKNKMSQMQGALDNYKLELNDRYDFSLRQISHQMHALKDNNEKKSAGFLSILHQQYLNREEIEAFQEDNVNAFREIVKQYNNNFTSLQLSSTQTTEELTELTSVCRLLSKGMTQIKSQLLSLLIPSTSDSFLSDSTINKEGISSMPTDKKNTRPVQQTGCLKNWFPTSLNQLTIQSSTNNHQCTTDDFGCLT